MWSRIRLAILHASQKFKKYKSIRTPRTKTTREDKKTSFMSLRSLGSFVSFPLPFLFYRNLNSGNVCTFTRKKMKQSRSQISLFAFSCAFAWMQLAYCGKGEVTAFSPEYEEKVGPWFTGTLLSTSGHVVPVGYYNIEPYLFVTDQYGRYNNEWHGEKEPREIRVRPLFKMK